jgi:hypothetical protein
MCITTIKTCVLSKNIYFKNIYVGIICKKIKNSQSAYRQEFNCIIFA